MFFITEWLKFRAFTIPCKSPFTKVIIALSMATSVPGSIAMPTPLLARAGASFIPSPATYLRLVVMLSEGFLSECDFPFQQWLPITLNRPMLWKRLLLWRELPPHALCSRCRSFREYNRCVSFCYFPDITITAMADGHKIPQCAIWAYCDLNCSDSWKSRSDLSQAYYIFKPTPKRRSTLLGNKTNSDDFSSRWST